MTTLHYYWPIAVIVLSNIFYHICSKSIPDHIHPMAFLTVTYLVGAAASGLLFFLMPHSGSLLQEYRHLNWTAFFMGLALVGLEVGCIYMYKAGWNVNTGQVVYSAILTIALVFVGYFLYKETITTDKIIGIVLCMAGLYFINK